MDADSIIILGLCVVLLIVLILLYIKDKQTDAKFDRFDQIVTDNMNGIFALQKEINALKEVMDEINIGDFSEQIDLQVEEKIAPIIHSLKGIDELVKKSIKDRKNVE
ncbi:hypothetical protein [Campylobacter geochelonis]|uniref:Periplasmic protein n=1 Tax=Campylobacter geochelonis TaxID=1780362 RepID=A0A128ECC0_9BACT|nr:hypothetical protein [Campylobacter geochelonis]QKF70555.1 hypothetical protein CGEO_0222 [Campylobacter geochelonis]CZE46048.1 Uncharacterised protein [Campylobacter geochelonis]CZE46589.1 Uncharacterised protein [Campylobacter geochelonis]CZE50403.1 Uncharacterised protein [Campylobacter geochelonis]